jgi:GAF domain-containing protein
MPAGYTMRKSFLGVPIISGEHAIGGIALHDPDNQHSYTESDLRLLNTIASSMGVALENARLFDEVQKRNQEISESLERETASNDILSVIAESPSDIQPVLDVIVRNAAQLSGSDDAIIANVESGVLRVAAHYGNIPTFPVGEGIPIDRHSVAGRSILDGRPYQAIHNQRGVKSSYPAGDKVARKFGYRVTCAVPLMREGVAIGAISIRRTRPELLTEAHIALIQSFANQAAIAIENVRLFDETRRLLAETELRAGELTIINRISQGLVQSLDFLEIINLVGNELAQIFASQDGKPLFRLVVALYDDTNKMLEIPYWFEDGEVLRSIAPYPLGPGLLSKVIHGRHPLMVGNTQEIVELGAIHLNCDGSQTLIADLEEIPADLPESWLGVPILVGERVIGALSVADRRQNR